MRLEGRFVTRRNARHSRLPVLAILATLGMAAAACSGGDSSSDSTIPPEAGPSEPADGEKPDTPSPGVTEDTIRISLSGPYSAFGDFYKSQQDAGFGVWLNKVNAEGGIHGRRIEPVEVDNALTPDGAIAACEEEKGNDTLFAVITAGYGSESTCLEDAGIPSLVNLVDQVDPDWELVRYVESVRTWGATMAELLDEAGAGSTIGIIFLRDLAYGFEAKDEFLKRADDLGMEIVATEEVATGQASFVSELQRLRSAGAETVMMFVTTDVIGILRDAGSIDFHPQWGLTGFVVDTLAQSVRDPLKGVLGARSTATIESEAYPDYVAAAEKYGDEGITPTADAMGGYGMGLIIQAVLEAAGPDLSRESLIEAFDAMDGLDTGGIYPPLSWTEGPAGTDTAFKVVCCNDDFTWRAYEDG